MGHVRAAEALYLYCQKFHPEIAAAHIDLSDFSTFLLSASATTGYAYMVRHLPKLFKALYRLADSPIRAKGIAKLGPLVRFNARRLFKYIDDLQPDRIICTHFLVAPLLKRYSGKIPIDMVVTDFYANKIWLSPYVRKYFVADEHTKKSLGKNIKNVVVSGLPLHPEFLIKKDAQKIKQKLGLNNGRPTILLLSGGQGLADTSKAAKEILCSLPETNLIAISGKNNEKLYKKLKTLKNKKQGKYKVIKFTDNIDEWMRAGDLVVTKPGGMTVAECLYLQKPMLLISPIPGQEERNAEFLEEKNYGCRVKYGYGLPVWAQKILHGSICIPPPAPCGKCANEIIING